MPTYRLSGPDGSAYDITAPEGATMEQVQAVAMQHIQQAPVDEPPAAKTGGLLSTVGAALQRGAADIAGLPVDTISNVADLGRAGIGTIATMAGRPDLAPDIPDRSKIVGSSEYLAAKARNAGIAVDPSDPASAWNRTVYAGARGAAGALIPSGAGVAGSVPGGGGGGSGAGNSGAGGDGMIIIYEFY